MGPREPVVPSEFVLVPHRPKEAQKESSGREHVARAAQKHLSGRGRFAGKADDVQASHHHARGCAAEDGEECEVLQIDDGKSRGVHGCAQFAQRELPSERAEEHQESTIGKHQAAEIDQPREASIVDGCHGMKPGQRFPFVFSNMCLRASF